MADANQPTELSRKFVAKFGAEYASLLTPSEMVDVCLEWAEAWHAMRVRNMITLVRDYPEDTGWVNRDYATEGYSTLVEEFNLVAHSYDLRTDMLLLPMNLHFNRRGVPALRALFEKLYFISEKDLYDLYRWTKDKSEVTGRQTEGSKLFCYMANYLEEYFGWREDVRGLLAVYSLGKTIREDLVRLDKYMQVAVEVMTRAIRERRERGPGAGPGGVKVPWHWNNLRNALNRVNQEVTDTTVRHNLIQLIRTVRRGTIRNLTKTSNGFPTKPEVEMQQIPDMPSLMATVPSSASDSGMQAAPPTASSSNQGPSNSGVASGKKVFRAFGTRKQNDSTPGPSNTQNTANTGGQGAGSSSGPKNPWRRNDSTQNTANAGQGAGSSGGPKNPWRRNDSTQNTANAGQGAGSSSGPKNSWRRNDSTQNTSNSGQGGNPKMAFPWRKRDSGYGGRLGKRAHWWEDPEPQDYEATTVKKRRTSED